jgi:integrase
MADPIKKGTRPDGSIYYWFRVSAGHDATGKRIQVYRSGDRRRDVLAEYAKVVSQVSEQRFVAKDDITVSAYLDKWEPANGRGLEKGSRTQIRHALQHVRSHLGERKFQTITRWDVEALVDWMQTAGRKRGGRPGTPLGPRTITLMLTHFQKACEDAVEEKLIGTNPCRKVKRPKQDKPEHELWSDEETARFEAEAAADRLHPVITLQCLGLRPEEVCGLRWRRDIKLPKRTAEIKMVRTLVDGQVVEKPPKTDAGARTLPLDDALTAALTAFHALQASEKLAAGPAYTAGDYVLCDELGQPYDPARLRRVWYRLMRKAGVRKIKPYDASRHAAGSRLAHAGVSPDIIAAWLGHTDASFTMRTYVHARPEDLATARDALAARKINEG